MKENLKDVIKMVKPNKASILKKCNVEVSIDGAIYKGKAEVRLDLMPRAHINIYTMFSELPTIVGLKFLSGTPEPKSIKLEGRSVPVLLLAIGGDKTKQHIRWSTNEPCILNGGEETRIERIEFDLYNFRDLMGNEKIIEEVDSIIYHYRFFKLSAAGWEISIKPMVKIREIIDMLSAEGGYGITHRGTIRKEKGLLFTGKEATAILNVLSRFLSFVKGANCNPVCAIGYDRDGKRVWEFFNSPREPWSSPLSWLTFLQGSELFDLFPGFIKKCEEISWQQTFQEAIYFYENSNKSTGKVDIGIILAQAAIERLSFEYSVKYSKLIEMQGFTNLRASDKMRLLFSSLGIPIEIPNILEKMRAASNKFKWIDAPHALTEIRNSLIHPEHKYHGILSQIYFEAWNLGLWFLELCILRLCGFSGLYSNRLSLPQQAGKVEKVPWVVEKKVIS